MGLTLSIDASDIQKALFDLEGIKIEAEDLSRHAPKIRLILQEDVDFRFANAPNTETGGEVWGGENWQELSESYLAANPRRYNGQILRDTGELMQSLTSEGHPYHVFNSTEKELVFGTGLAKAPRLHGKRPFLFWHVELINKVAKSIGDSILGG